MSKKDGVLISNLLYDREALARLEKRACKEKGCSNVSCVYILHTLRKYFAKVESEHDMPNFTREIFAATGVWFDEYRFSPLFSDMPLALIALISAEMETEIPAEYIAQDLADCNTAEDDQEYDETATGIAILQLITKYTA